MLKQTIPPASLPPLMVAYCTKDEIAELVRQAIKEELLANKILELQEHLHSRKELAKILDVSEVTIATWEKEGRIQSHRLGNRVYYKHSEIMASLQTLKKYKKA